MRVLIGCEESQEVCKAFRALGYEAYSCDLQECSGGHPEWHIQGDVFDAIKTVQPDLMIAHPPCTHLANAGGSHFAKKRIDGRQKEAIVFFMNMLSIDVPFVCLENPVGILSSQYIYSHFPELIPLCKSVGMPRKPDQVIQPFYFGDNLRKYTCLWLKNLPPLVWVRQSDLLNTSMYVDPAGPIKQIIRKGKSRTGTKRNLYWYDSLSGKNAAKIKSKTFPGIAHAMAEQWGSYVSEQLKKKTA